MNAFLFQVLVDLLFLTAFGITWLKLMRPQKDDPRLSRGLQLLQSKIAVLEDLGDQTDRQFQQMSQLLEAKGREIQSHVDRADEQIRKIELSLGKSLEVANIFQDRIPHQEIIDRKLTAKYVKAARLAHQGMSVDEIAGQVDLSSAEIEFAVKVNRDELQFSEEDLPEWARPNEQDSQHNLSPRPNAPVVGLSRLGDRFREALGSEPESPPVLEPAKAAPTPAPAPLPATVPTPVPALKSAATRTDSAVVDEVPTGKVVKKVIFPRLEDAERRAYEKKMIDRNLI